MGTVYYKGEKLLLLPYSFTEKVMTKIYNDHAFKQHQDILKLDILIGRLNQRGHFDKDGNVYKEGEIYYAVNNKELNWLREKFDEII